MANLMILSEDESYAGDLLNQALLVAGTSISKCSTVTLAPFKIRESKSKYFFSGGSPTPSFMEGILGLIEEVKRTQPRVILAFGDYSLWALTQQKGVFTKRGSPIPSNLPGSPTVIPTLSPQWYLGTRQFQKIPQFEWDVAKAVRLSKSGWTHPREECSFTIDPSEQELMETLEHYRGLSKFAVDTEWYSPEVLAYVGFADSARSAITIPASDDFRKGMIQEMLALPGKKIMQNAMFDMVALARLGYSVENLADDTMVAWHWSWPRLGEKGLGFLTSVLTDWPYYKGDVEFVGSDDRKGQEYCCTDCVITYESMEKIEAEEFPATLGRKGYEISMKMMDPFVKASEIGIRADLEKLDKLEKHYTETADRLEAALGEVIGHSINCGSSKQVCELVYDEIGIPGRSKRTSKQEVLMDIAASETRDDVKEILTAVIRVRQNRGMVSRYINRSIVDRDGRVRANWNLANTLSGRLSTTKPWWNGVALQTVPLAARAVYVPDPGYVFVGHDLAQAEARFVAAETRDYDLLDAMDLGKDVHALLAPMLDLTYEQIMQMVADAQAKGKSKDEVEERFLLKTCRHSMNYIQTWAGLKARVNKKYLDTGIGITASKAKELASGYLDLNPGLEPWWYEIYLKVKRDGWLENSFGRRVSFPGENTSIRQRDHIHRSAVSYRPQSTIGDLTTLGIRAVWDKHPWMQILVHAHDGSLYQVSEERKEEAEEILMKEMAIPIRAGRMMIDIPVETKSGMSWKEMG